MGGRGSLEAFELVAHEVLEIRPGGRGARSAAALPVDVGSEPRYRVEGAADPRGTLVRRLGGSCARRPPEREDPW